MPPAEDLPGVKPSSCRGLDGPCKKGASGTKRVSRRWRVRPIRRKLPLGPNGPVYDVELVQS